MLSHLHGAVHKADGTQKHREHGKLWSDQLVLWSGVIVSSVRQNDHRSSSDEEPVRQPLLPVRIHNLGSNYYSNRLNAPQIWNQELLFFNPGHRQNLSTRRTHGLLACLLQVRHLLPFNR
uniref:Uncharacterized protein n=1 Tax=Arundo donax TaxID=35708 RepID=A0A0A9GK62_ARUDO